MLTATSSLTKGRRAGRPLPHVPELDDLHDGWFRFWFRASELTMIAGQPGSQKSGFALWLASKFAIPTLYFSADSSAWTVSTRLAAAMTRHTTETVGKGMAAGADDYYSDILATSPIRFCYDPNPSASTLQGELDAWVEAWDEYPQLIVVDNLMDVVGAGDNETAAAKDVLLGLKTIARTTEAAVWVLHHMSETGTDPRVPSPRKALMGKVAQTPENILSIAIAEDPTEFLISVVKQRSGPSDPTATRRERLRVHPERNVFEKWRSIVPAMTPPEGKFWND